jgi:glycerophosphoryl diester phosphodiesterase
MRRLFRSLPAILFPMQIIAHRGVTGRYADENSLEAIRRAVVLGVDGIEIDLRRSRDDEAVLVHDADLRRIAGDVRQVANLTASELTEVSLRHGTRIPTLEEVTANVPAPTQMYLEIKDRNAFELVARKLNTSAGLRARTSILSFSQEVIEDALRLLPDVRRTLLLRRWPMRTVSFFAWARAQELSGVGLITRSWTARRVARVHREGLQAVTWELFEMRSTARRAERLLAQGVDVAIVNQPQVYQNVMNQGS